jgi:hypothetical protein
MSVSDLWDRLAGGALPFIQRRPREVFMVDGTAYRIELVWFRRRIQLKYTTPVVPRAVRRIRDAEQARGSEMVRRHAAGEPALQVGDLIPKWATAFVDRCQQVRANDGTMWKRAEGDDRYAVEDDGSTSHGQEYEWIAFLAGKWGGGWCTTEGLLFEAPLTALELVTDAAA